MRFWKKRLQRVAAMVCSVALAASMMPTAAFATEPEPTPTPEPASVVETTPTPDPSESPVNTDATVSTSAPDAGADSTAAPVETPTETPDGTPVPSEKPVESPEPSEVPAEQEQPAPQMLAAAPAPAAAPRAANFAYTLYEEGDVFVRLSKDIGSLLEYTVNYEVWLEGEQVAEGTMEDVPGAAINVSYSDGYDASFSGDKTYVDGNILTVNGDNATLIVSLAKEKQQDTITIEDESSDEVYGTFQWVKGTAVNSAFLRTITIRVNGEVKWSQKVTTPLTLTGGVANPEYSFTPNLSKYNSEVKFDNLDYDSATQQDITIDLTTKCPCGQLGCQCEGGASCTCQVGCDCEKCQPKDENVIITEYGTIRYTPQGDDDVANNRTVRVELYVNGSKVETSEEIPALKLDSSRTGALTFEPADGYYFHHNDDGSLNGYDLESPFAVAPSWQPETGFLTIPGDSNRNPDHATLVNTLKIYLWTFKDSVAINVDRIPGVEHVNNYTLSFEAVNPETGKIEKYSYPAISWDATQLQLVPFGSRVTLTADCDPYYEVSEWNMSHAPTLVYLDGEEGRSSLIEGGTNQYAYGNTAYLDILSGGIPRVDILITDTRTVNPPTEEEMQELLGDENPAVQVSCTSDATHTAQNYALKSGSYDKADQMGGNSVDNYTYTITVYPDQYVAAYNETTDKTHSDVTPDSQEIVFEYVAGRWTVQTETPVKFEVTCEEETTDIPPVDVEKLGHEVVTIRCTNTAAGHEVMNVGILGAENTDYTVAYSEEKTSATITITNAAKYVQEYNGAHNKPQHKAGEISDSTIKVKYDKTAKEWVIDLSDNTATVDVTCEDTAVTSVNLEKTITQIKRGGEVFTGQNIPQMLKVGDEITYQINVTNTGDVNLEDLTVTDTFTGNNKPNESDGITWTGAAGNWTGTISDIKLPVGETKTYKYTYIVAEEDKGKTITNKATIKGEDSEDPKDDDETKTEVENPAVGVEKSLVQVKRGEEIFLAYEGTIPEQLEVGDELTYEIEVKNIGNVKLNGLTLTDTFNGHFAPSKVKDKDANVELTYEWVQNETTKLWTLEIGDILPDVGEIETYTYTYTVNQADAGKNLTNTAAVTGGGTDPDDSKDEDKHPVKDDGKVTLQPADITIYMGGEDGYGDSNSLPEPGFYITLPDKVEEALKTKLGLENGVAADLSEIITGVTATTADGQTRHWTMKQYGADDSTAWIDDTKQEHFVYRIVPGRDQPAISVNFTKEDGTTITEDDFTPAESASLSATYFMSLNTASVDVETISLTFDIEGEIFHCGYNAEESKKNPGTLTVRYTTTADAPTTLAAKSDEELKVRIEQNPDSYYVQVANNEQKFYINEQDVGADGVDVTHDDVSLLADNIVSDQANAEAANAMVQKAFDAANFDEPAAWSKYLDLVDAKNGNAWLTPADGSEVTVFWPYPEGVTMDSEIKLYHFDGLDRDMATDELLEQVKRTEAKPVTIIERLEDGFTFKTSSFSPFVLVQNTTQPSGGEDKPSGGDDGNNNNNNNNSNTNEQTTTVNVTNEAPAPAAAPAAVAVPQTSDDMPIGALTAAAAAAAAAFVALVVVRKRRHGKD